MLKTRAGLFDDLASLIAWLHSYETPVLSASMRIASIGPMRSGSRRRRRQTTRMPKLLIAIGLAWLAGERLGLGRLPGDFVFERGNVRFYFPFATSILINVVLTLVLWLVGR